MKNIEEYKVIDFKIIDFKDGTFCAFHYETEDGCVHNDIQSLLIKKLPMCGCGNPEENLEFIYNMISIHIEENIKYEDRQEKIKNYLQNNWEKSYQFFLNVLNTINGDSRLLTHGGSIYGSWIDDKNMWNALQQWYSEYQDKIK